MERNRDFWRDENSIFKSFLDLENGIPSHDTFRRFFMFLKTESLLNFFNHWISSFNKDEIKQICIDGKTLRGSKRKGNRGIHIINAFSTGLGLSLGQLKTDEKSNEITAIPELVESLDIKDTLVSVDALNCQKEIAEKFTLAEITHRAFYTLHFFQSAGDDLPLQF